jgi:hypothetical protein
MAQVPGLKEMSTFDFSNGAHLPRLKRMKNVNDRRMKVHKLSVRLVSFEEIFLFLRFIPILFLWKLLVGR